MPDRQKLADPPMNKLSLGEFVIFRGMINAGTKLCFSGA